MSTTMTGAVLRDMLLCAYEALESSQQAINELNVFPVPDGDTGTNMALTMSAAAAELRKAEADSVSEVANKAASAMLRGARGNSGVILSLLFRGIARGLKGKESCSAREFADSMNLGVDAAYKAVMKPAEGTILTVSRLASAAALDLAKSEKGLELMFDLAIDAAREALDKTVEQNPVLARAGVVDAGGKGYVLILEAFLGSLRGTVRPGMVAASGGEEAARGSFEVFDTSEITFAYDTVYIVRKTGEVNLDLLRAYLDSIGDSLVISEDDEIFKVHVHTNAPGDALNESQKYGVLELAKIENMRSQHEAIVSGQKRATADDAEETEPELVPASKPCGFVSVCAGEGLRQLFLELGCDRIVTGGQTMNPSTEDILREINRTPAETVFVFPNNKNIIMAAEQCIPLTEKKVVVIPTKTVPQGITAMLNLDGDASAEAMEECFRSVIDGVHTALVTYAARNSDFDGHKIKAGEYLGLLDGALLGSWGSMNTLIKQLCRAFKKLSPEFLSVYYGEDVAEEDAQVLAEALAKAFPDAELNILSGGQPVYYYMISVE